MVSLNKKYCIRSSSGLADVNVQCFYPDDSISVKGIVQIAHGMAEHFERYMDFIEKLNENGFVVFINDHLGHGKSVANNNELGFFGKNNGYRNLVNDMKLVTDLAKSEFPDLPLILFGHSMGSFLARYYTELYGDELKAVVYCGTAGSNPAASLGIKIAEFVEKSKGDHCRSEFINNMAFGSYNKKIKPARTDFDWLTKDNDIVDEYVNDKYCGFLFTASGYKDLFTLLSIVNRKDWYTSFNNDLPIFIIAGEEDPVGSYGKGVNEVYKKLVNSGHTNTLLKLYPDDRHEILNETDKEAVMQDVVDWMTGNL